MGWRIQTIWSSAHLMLITTTRRVTVLLGVEVVFGGVTIGGKTLTDITVETIMSRFK